MRNRETYFEQVPIEVVETVLQHITVPEKNPEESPASNSALERNAVLEFPKRNKSAPSKGRR